MLALISAVVLAGFVQVTCARAVREGHSEQLFAAPAPPPRVGFLSEWRSRFGDGFQHSSPGDVPDVSSCTTYNFTQPVRGGVCDGGESES